MVRASLIYLLLAAAPLGLAVRVWPQLRGVWHSFVRLGVALIVSKFVVALALGLGAAALGGGGPTDGDFGTQAGLTLQAVVVGVTLMSLASFSPFLVLKLIPLFEAALVAQGISRGPARAAQTGLQGAYYAKGLQRLAGGARPGRRGHGAQRRVADRRGAEVVAAQVEGAGRRAAGSGVASASPASAGSASAAGGGAAGGAAAGGGAAAAGAGAAAGARRRGHGPGGSGQGPVRQGQGGRR